MAEKYSSPVCILTSCLAKPAPWGTIGICALDIKARSKPSRHILNRLIANRDFDVVVFGDKVILDEGSSVALFDPVPCHPVSMRKE